VNINNLAAVPSIVFGLLGLAVFIQFLRAAALGAAGRRPGAGADDPADDHHREPRGAEGVPPSIREAALGMGASEVQTVAHHVLPLAMPGMLTGAIIGMARALGESAPLLMIGMVAFIVDVPAASDPSTVLPVQIYLWADSPSAPSSSAPRPRSSCCWVPAGHERDGGLLRQRFERRW
jgi:phosphate transport system permease protein